MAFQANDNGAILLTGNNVLTCSTVAGAAGAGNCSAARAGASVNNNDYAMVDIDADSDPGTRNSSAADLALPTTGCRRRCSCSPAARW